MIILQGMSIFAIGITEAVHDEQLKNIAGSPDRVYKTRDFTSLDERLREQIMSQICGGTIGVLNDINRLPLPAATQITNSLDNIDVVFRDPRITSTQRQLDSRSFLLLIRVALPHLYNGK